MLPKASLAVVVGARPDLLPRDMDAFWPQDCAAATENLLIQAAALGYGAVWCGVYPDMQRVEKIKTILGGESVPFSVIAVGVPNEKPSARGYYDPERVRTV
jgi:nitroreductase